MNGIPLSYPELKDDAINDDTVTFSKLETENAVKPTANSTLIQLDQEKGDNGVSTMEILATENDKSDDADVVNKDKDKNNHNVLIIEKENLNAAAAAAADIVVNNDKNSNNDKLMLEKEIDQEKMENPHLSKRSLRRQKRANAWKAHKLEKKLKRVPTQVEEQVDIDDPEKQLYRSEKQKSKKERFLMGTEEGYNIVLDCSFESCMHSREKKSLSQQIMFSYGANRRSSFPSSLYLTSLQGETKSLLENISGFSSWLAAMKTDQNYLNVFKKETLVYLTADSPNTIETLDPSKVYIIGAIVDRNRLKGVTYKKAEAEGIATAKLPLDQYCELGCLTRVLTVNHVVSILLHYGATKDWSQAIQQALPKRKIAPTNQESTKTTLTIENKNPAGGDEDDGTFIQG